MLCFDPAALLCLLDTGVSAPQPTAVSEAGGGDHGFAKRTIFSESVGRPDRFAQVDLLESSTKLERGGRLNKLLEDPAVPKRLAARLRASYGRVYSARDKIAYVEAKSRNTLMELGEFEADAHRYAAQYFPSAPDPDDYPTVTRTGRLQTWVEDKARKIPVYHEELLEVEASMEKVETEVLTELHKMRSNTPGREPWPTRPQSLDALREHWERWYANERRESAKFMKERLERRKRDAEHREADRQAIIAEVRESVQLKAAVMSPGKAAAYLSMMEVLEARLLGESLTFLDIYDIAQGNSVKMRAMIAEAEQRAIARLSGGAEVG